MNTTSKSSHPKGRVRTAYLLEQARYFVTLVQGDPVVSKRLGTKFLEKFEAGVARLEAQLGAVAKARFESRERLMAVETLAADAVTWARGFRRMYSHAGRIRDGLPALPSGAPSAGVNPAKLATLVVSLAEHGVKHADVLAEFGLDAAFYEQGRRVGAALLAADAQQEKARRTGLPESYEGLRDVKSSVHEGVKRIALMGRTAYERDRAKARLYSLRILYHGTPSRSPQAPPVPAKPDVA